MVTAASRDQPDRPCIVTIPLDSSPTDSTKTLWPSRTPFSGRQRVGMNVADLRLEAFK
jgi:hypothetical protein